MDKILTVFTPAYNRAYTLHKCYESLTRQTNKNFKWMIIDDGSTDNTANLVAKWKEESDFEIIYIYKQNRGMHTAHNTAYENIDTELNVCIDSDDYLTDEKFSVVSGLLKDFVPVVASEKYVIVASDLISMVDRINDDIIDVEMFFRKLFDFNIFVVAITTDRWKDEKNKEQKDKEVWREIALKKENLLIERQKNSSLSSNEKPNIFKKFNKR